MLSLFLILFMYSKRDDAWPFFVFLFFVKSIYFLINFFGIKSHRADSRCIWFIVYYLFHLWLFLSLCVFQRLPEPRNKGKKTQSTTTTMTTILATLAPLRPLLAVASWPSLCDCLPACLPPLILRLLSRSPFSSLSVSLAHYPQPSQLVKDW